MFCICLSLGGLIAFVLVLGLQETFGTYDT